MYGSTTQWARLEVSLGSEIGRSQVKSFPTNKVTLPSQHAYVRGTDTTKQCEPYVVHWHPTPLNISLWDENQNEKVDSKLGWRNFYPLLHNSCV